MNKVVEFLNVNPVQYLATVGRDGKAKCRPFMFAGELDGKLWFCTNNTKDVYKDMQANPEIEISVSSPEYAWIRLHGKAVFENNMAAKEMCIQNPIVKGQYGEEFSEVFDSYSLSEKDYYKQFDETVKKELPKSYTYDAKTGRVTTTAFTGDINRWEQTITVDKAGDSDAFKKGDVLDYTPNNGGFTIKAHSEFGDISFTKK